MYIYSCRHRQNPSVLAGLPLIPLWLHLCYSGGFVSQTVTYSWDHSCIINTYSLLTSSSWRSWKPFTELLFPLSSHCCCVIDGIINTDLVSLTWNPSHPRFFPDPTSQWSQNHHFRNASNIRLLPSTLVWLRSLPPLKSPIMTAFTPFHSILHATAWILLQKVNSSVSFTYIRYSVASIWLKSKLSSCHARPVFMELCIPTYLYSLIFPYTLPWTLTTHTEVFMLLSTC